VVDDSFASAHDSEQASFESWRAPSIRLFPGLPSLEVQFRTARSEQCTGGIFDMGPVMRVILRDGFEQSLPIPQTIKPGNRKEMRDLVASFFEQSAELEALDLLHPDGLMLMFIDRNARRKGLSHNVVATAIFRTARTAPTLNQDPRSLPAIYGPAVILDWCTATDHELRSPP
jgi:hypothetical protein